MSVLTSELKKSNEFLNILIDTIPTAIMVVNKDARIMAFNNSLSSLFKKSQENLIEQLCGNGIGCAFEVESNLDCGCTEYCNICPLRKGILDAINKNLITENKLLKRNFYINNSSVTKYLRFTIKPILINKNNYGLLFFDDVTEFYELAEKRNELLGIAAHDIRNPLSIIKMYVDYLNSHSEKNNEKISKAYSIIDESIQYMIDLLNDILDYASFEKSEIKLNYMEIDYISFIKSIISLQQLIASEKKIILNFTTTHETIKTQFDSNKMTQIINNLISNAIKYSYENTNINIKTSIIEDNQKKYLKTEVIDEGPGIDIKEQNKLFKPFSRTSVRPIGNESSTGLGLAIAKKIVDAHKGKIGVISAPLKGSNFWFTIPIID